ncbi:protoglobin domain-containing protein [Streptomyces spiralis]
MGLTSEDEHYLRMAADVLSPQAEAMVDTWRGLIAEQPHLAACSAHPDGRPNPEYSAASKPRFGQWITDVCTRPYDHAAQAGREGPPQPGPGCQWSPRKTCLTSRSA